MVKAVCLILLTLSLYANPYEDNCIPCHKNMTTGLDTFFYLYLQTYSSERRIKQALMDYLKAPSQTKSVMPLSFFQTHILKKPTALDEAQLQESINLYWESYKIFGKLK